MGTHLLRQRGMQLIIIGAMLLAALGVTSPAAAQSTCGATITVARGDTMRIIAAKCGVTLADLEKANTKIPNFDLIFPGQVINIPGGTPVVGTPTLTLSATSGNPGTAVTVTGAGFPANTTINFAVGPQNTSAVVNGSTTSDGNGNFSQAITIPVSAQPGSWSITATARTSGGPSVTASFQVAATVASGAYTVVKGDTLLAIAVHFNTTLNAVLRANPQITNPDRIEVGQQVFIPGTLVVINGQKIYFVKQGDFMNQIAANQKVTLANLMKANPQITNPSLIYPGQRITIP